VHRATGPFIIAIYHPQLARLVKQPPEGNEWLHEMKYDGYRIGCRIRDRSVALISRNGKDWTAAFPEIVEAARQLGVRDALLDGEVAIVLPDGRTSFQALQNAFSGGSRRGLVYFAFDLLRISGNSLERRPLEERKRELLRLTGKPGPKAAIRYSEHVVGRGAEMFQEACRLRLEGIISKRIDAPYKRGRGDTWLKTKCVLRQEFVIGGFTDPEGSRQGIGALLIGYYDAAGTLVFAGKVGTGFSVASAHDLRKRLNAIERKDCPFRPRPTGALGKRAHWVKPAVVAEVVFTEWTEDGKIRHPSFQGLRRDKPAKAVTREVPADAPPPMPRRLGANPTATRAAKQDSAAVAAGVRISNPDRVLYADLGITKLDVAQFYERIADWIVPHLKGRPLTLVRCPEGIQAECFYMKHSKVWAPPALRRVKIQEKAKVGDYLVADTPAAVVSLVQMGILEIHTWNTRVERVELPDRIVLDIDPGSKVPWTAVIATARRLRRALDKLNLESFLKTTGGRGLHVVVPLAPSVDWKTCLAFSRAIAVALERADPATYTTAFAKAGREGKILIDYLRNNRTNTSVAAYSTRARPGCPVSVPLRWEELKPALDPASFTIRTIEKRLAKLKADPWAGYWKCRQKLPASWDFADHDV
jgi:bifunctional non-homologous end joining protein LigD